MKYTKSNEEKSRVTIDYVVTMEEFEPYLEKSYQKNKHQFSLPGFRKGKVPRKMVELNWGKEVLFDDALNALIPDLYEESIRELDLEPVTQPVFTMDEVGEEEIKFNAVIALMPEVKLGQYKDFDIEELSTEVTDEDVEERIKKEAEANARLVPIKRKAKKGDVATIDFEGFVDGEAFEGGKAEGYDLELGSNTFIPGFEKGLMGCKTGEEHDVEVTFPEDYPGELAGKDAVFKVKVHEVKTKELPEIDDEFAQDVSEYDTLDEYKEYLKEEIKKEKEEAAVNHKADETYKRIIENLEVELPQEMIDQEAERLIQDFEHRLSHQNFSIDQYLEATGSTREEMLDNFKPQAEMNIKQSLAVEEIAKAENFDVTQEEIDEELKAIQESTNTSLEELEKIFGKDDYAMIKEDKKRRKAFEIMRGNI